MRGFDLSRVAVETARVINDHIEMQDVEFCTEDPGGTYDNIFYFSVHHQWDEPYLKLADKLAELRSRARLAVFVELITPDLGNRLTRAQVDGLVNGVKLLEYKHAVRRHRAIYKLDGAA